VETSEANPPLSAKGNPQLEKSCGFFIFTVILRTRVLKIIVKIKKIPRTLAEVDFYGWYGLHFFWDQ